MPQEDKRLIIRVDHSQHPNVPNWLGEAVHPDWERVGPTEYDLEALNPWRHDGQKHGYQMTGNAIYRYLQENNMIASCLSLLDGQAIQAQASAADFRRHTKCSSAALWGSVRPYGSHSESLHVLCIIIEQGGNKLELRWNFLGWYFDGRIPALRFPESMLNTAPVIS